jgi:hypothetical protein
MSMVAEQDITESLFEDLGVESKNLKKEADYSEFGKKVNKVLHEGQAPYNIPFFYKELMKDIGKYSDKDAIKKVLDSLTTIYNEKVKEQNAPTGKKGGKAKPGLGGAGKVMVN